MNISNQLYRTIVNTIDSFDTIENFDRENVFTELMQFSKSVSSQEDIFKMYFVFNKHKKILHFLRTGDIVLAEYNLKYLVDKNIIYFNELSKISIDSLYFPVVSYYFYKKNDYLNAKINLDKAYSEFDKLYEEGYQNIVFNFVEQKINEFRILVHQKKWDESIVLIKKLFQNIISDNHFYHFDCVFKNLCLDDNELISYINYVIDICSSYFILKKDAIKINDKYALEFTQALSSVFSSFYIKNIGFYLDALDLILTNKIEKFLRFAIVNPNSIINKNTSCSFAYIFYKIILDYLYKYDISLYEKSIKIFSAKNSFDSYKCFIEKLLQDEVS